MYFATGVNTSNYGDFAWPVNLLYNVVAGVVERNSGTSVAFNEQGYTGARARSVVAVSLLNKGI